MLSHSKLAFIGSGVMAEAMIRCLLEKKLVQPGLLTCADPQASRRDFLTKQYGVKTTSDNASAVREADIVVMSIKPQVLSDVSDELKMALRPEALVLSIMAGVTTTSLRKRLGHEAVARAMPNTPAQIGMGVSVWCSTPTVSEQHIEQARVILQALGSEHFVKKEDMLDMATALSGSAPAYVFLFMEALMDAGVHMGFSRQVAHDLVVQTVKGSAEFASQSTDHMAHLRNMVTSPGGTTADAIYYLEKGGLRTVISQAVRAAYLKSQALSRLGEED